MSCWHFRKCLLFQCRCCRDIIPPLSRKWNTAKYQARVNVDAAASLRTKAAPVWNQSLQAKCHRIDSEDDSVCEIICVCSGAWARSIDFQWICSGNTASIRESDRQSTAQDWEEAQRVCLCSVCCIIVSRAAEESLTYVGLYFSDLERRGPAALYLQPRALWWCVFVGQPTEDRQTSS